MKFSVEKEILLSGIQIIQTIITTKTTLPILSNALLECQKDNLRLTATDLDVGISCLIPVETQEVGAITIPAKKFYDIIKELPEGRINISVKRNNFVLITTNTCQFKLVGLTKEEFPKLPEFKDKEVLVIEQKILKSLLTLTEFAVSYDETRYILNGILFKINTNKLSLVATDGKRLAIAEQEISEKIKDEISVVVPIKAVRELSRNLNEDGVVSIILSENQIMFDLKNMVIISRLIEGEFPDYKHVIPPPQENKLIVDREQFLLSIKRASLLSIPDHQEVKLELTKNKLIISKTTPDLGESWEELECSYSGKEMIIGFDYNFLLDVLKNLKTEKIELELKDPESPGVIRIRGYIYIVLPIRLG